MITKIKTKYHLALASSFEVKINLKTPLGRFKKYIQAVKFVCITDCQWSRCILMYFGELSDMDLTGKVRMISYKFRMKTW